MLFRRQPLFLYIAALSIFCITAILPLGYMLGQFIVRLFSQPLSVIKLFIDTRQLVLLGRSLGIASLATLFALTLGLPVAVMLAAKDLPFKKLFYFLTLVPVLIPSYVMAGAWIHLLSPSGLLNLTLAALFGPGVKLTIFSSIGCAWCLGISFFPVIAVIVGTGLSQIDGSLVDIARLSTGRWGVFRYGIAPQILPHLAASTSLVMIFVVAQYGVPSLLSINTYPVEIFAQFSAFYDDTGAVAIALPLVILVIFLIILQQHIMRNLDYIRISPSSEADSPIRIKKAKSFAAGFLIILFTVTIVLPFASVLAHVQSPVKVWSTLRSYGDSILTTSVLALLAAVISTVTAFFIGRELSRKNSRLTKILDVLCWLPIAIPGTIIGLGVIKLFSWVPALQKNDSFGVLLLCAYIGTFSGFSIRIFQAAEKRTDPNIAEAAALDCPRWYQRLFYIDIPINSGAIIASMIMVFVLATGELNATVLLIPPGKATLAVTIDNLLHYGSNVQASILCLTEAVFVVLIVSGGLFIRYIVGRR